MISRIMDRGSNTPAESLVGSFVDLLVDLRDDAGADGTAAFADGEAQPLLHRDRRDQLDLDRMLSPGITISTPSRQRHEPVTSVVRK